jgi:hypothetical protein
MLVRQESGEKFYVYRAFDAGGQLLYAGRSQDLARRFNGHVRYSHWIWQVESLTVERFATKVAQQRGELGAIFREHPRWNVQHVRDFHRASQARREAVSAAPPHSSEEWLALSTKVKDLLGQAVQQQTIYQWEPKS